MWRTNRKKRTFSRWLIIRKSWRVWVHQLERSKFMQMNKTLCETKTQVKPTIILKCLQFTSLTQSCLTLGDPMNCNTPGLPVHHQLPEFTQTNVHWVDNAIQPSHPLLSPSPLSLNLSQHQGLFKWVSSLH